MYKYLWLLTASGLLLAADAGEDAAKKELQRFQGTWVLVSGEKEGTKLADEDVQKSKISWQGKEVVVSTPHQSKEPIKGIVTVDPSKKPKEMEWTRSAGPGAGTPMHAIYEFLADGQYRVCFAPAGKERPKEFSTKPGTGHILHVWKRVKE